MQADVDPATGPAETVWPIDTGQFIQGGCSDATDRWKVCEDADAAALHVLTLGNPEHRAWKSIKAEKGTGRYLLSPLPSWLTLRQNR